MFMVLGIYFTHPLTCPFSSDFLTRMLSVVYGGPAGDSSARRRPPILRDYNDFIIIYTPAEAGDYI